MSAVCPRDGRDETAAAVLHMASINCFIGGKHKGKSLCVELSARAGPVPLTMRTAAQCLCTNSKEARWRARGVAGKPRNTLQ